MLGLDDNKSAKKYGYLYEPRWYNKMAQFIKNNPVEDTGCFLWARYPRNSLAF